MTSNPTTTRLPQLGQAVARLLDAIATSADYQRYGHVIYATTKQGGRWVNDDGHHCGGGTLTTAESNRLLAVEVVSPSTKKVSLTEAGRRYVHVRQARKLHEVLEGEHTTLADLHQNPDQPHGRNFTFPATLIGWIEGASKTNALFARLTLEHQGAACDAWVTPRGYAKIRNQLTAGAQVRVVARGAHRGDSDGRLILHLVAIRFDIDAAEGEVR
ncbi:hypothetical protein FAF44_02830 [Nonomuraea sp. MG754425]|uniref:hypothetical protein n=1 Tax=Nonomuraea sp. MG754425 TaxID=2570319 RepID=UPI001F19CFB8|nr:hypothetical protein [Nonomuraea sp. MG754425]MCF6467349.1 hypothetical protein [Nonomuraea sp. MG754425]